MTNEAAEEHPNGALYCRLMEFIKWRVEAVGKTIHLVRTNQSYLDNRLAAEFCLLQLRMCCELLAIGCLAIHTDVPQSKRLQKEWNANTIMRAIEALKPQFFPTAVRDEVLPNRIIQQHLVEGALTKKEFLDSYHLFGSMLHTGTLDRYKNSSPKTYDFSLLENFIDKLSKLLSNHTYLLNDNKTMIRVIMHNIKDGRVWLQPLVGRKIAPSSSSEESSSN